jgi:hypothetical protein
MSLLATVFPSFTGRESASLYECQGLPAPGVYEGTLEIITDPTFWIAAGISGIVGTAIYLTFGYMIQTMYHRKVRRPVPSRLFSPCLCPLTPPSSPHTPPPPP